MKCNVILFFQLRCLCRHHDIPNNGLPFFMRISIEIEMARISKLLLNCLEPSHVWFLVLHQLYLDRHVTLTSAMEKKKVTELAQSFRGQTCKKKKKCSMDLKSFLLLLWCVPVHSLYKHKIIVYKFKIHIAKWLRGHFLFVLAYSRRAELHTQCSLQSEIINVSNRGNEVKIS